MSFSSSQLRAIITGASSGIGEATTLTFAKAGIDLALISRPSDKLRAVARAAQELGVLARAYEIDLCQLTEIPVKVQQIAESFGGIDIIVNNAGMGYTNPLADTSLSDWQKVMDLNLTSVFQCVRGILPQMRKQGHGTIINVSSIAASNAFPKWGAYSVSKAGLAAFSRVLAAEEQANGIRIITINPGAVNTPIWDTDTVQADLNRSAMLDPYTVAQTILQAALLPAEAVIEEMTILPSAGIL
ncbi:MAG: SDR family oxidoreductase [cyanobacterium endosymbiont of Rhopalodia musculus]|uniref:SDR family oxidoreductase n=1 Tax=cyanobacterium endosymbiont of Epithemia clementina EcSB TaxID=3034674 RepID=UPI002480356A|nr:SDR family oxidoreductase [cyanobacterium endosymbiont of Epithemia clementina EcSB]WGT67289.1 SDR family oxidoreductase [cyanobacterium endosymbiont of Epithemia clementina EcSB]